MVRVTDTDRKRPYHSKSRTGCKTCLARRVKCDERKPSCKRCKSSSRQCEGYGDRFMSWTAKVHDADRRASVKTFPQPSRSLFTDFGDVKQRGAFSFYLTRTNTQLSGFYECEFWNKAVLQAAQSNPGIRHAVNALATFHRDFEESGKAADLDYVFALREYQFAIRSHIDNHGSLEGAGIAIGNSIACSLLFICIEMIQGHYESAISLIKSATNLFDSSLEALKAGTAWPFNAIERLFHHLHAQVIGLAGYSIQRDTSSTRESLPDLKMNQGGFKSLAEMREYFDIAYHIQSSREPIDNYSDIGEGVRIHRARTSKDEEFLAAWSKASDPVVHGKPNSPWTKHDEQALAILQMRRLAWAFDADFAKKQRGVDADQLLWDAYLPQYKSIVALAVKVHALYEDSSLAERNRYFTLDFGMISPLYNTARLCRNPVVRREAIRLLRARPMREGLWDSLAAARAAESQMEFEEAAVSSVMEACDIPLAARIFSLSPSFESEEPYVSVKFSKGRVTRTSESYTEKICW